MEWYELSDTQEVNYDLMSLVPEVSAIPRPLAVLRSPILAERVAGAIGMMRVKTVMELLADRKWLCGRPRAEFEELLRCMFFLFQFDLNKRLHLYRGVCNEPTCRNYRRWGYQCVADLTGDYTNFIFHFRHGKLVDLRQCYCLELPTRTGLTSGYTQLGDTPF